MPRRLNYTGRKKINRTDASISLHRNGDGLSFEADLRLADYKLDQIVPPPRVYVEAYRGASTLWKRFDFGRVGTIQPPPDRSLNEFSVPEGILFRVKVSAEGESLGKLLAEADRINPRMPDDADDYGIPLIQHVAAKDIGDELWRLDFSDGPLLKINDRVPMGVDQFLLDAQHRALFAPAVLRQVLTRILIIERETGDEDDDTDWRGRWIRFAARLTHASDDVRVVDKDNSNLDVVEEWIDSAVEAFTARAGLLHRFAPASLENQS